MSSCVVSASELFQRAKEMLNDGNTYVKIDFIEPDGEIPAMLGFSAWKNGGMEVGYDPIESV